MTNSLNFLKPYLRGWPIIVVAMIIGYMIASKYLNYVTPMYESSAKIRLADLNEGVPNSNLFKDFDVFASAQKINAEIELLKSHTLISKALRKVSFDVQISRAGKFRNTELFKNSPITIEPLEWNEALKDKIFHLTVHANHSFVITAPSGEQYNGKLGDTITIKNRKIVFKLNESFLKENEYIKISDNYFFSVLSLSKQISEVNKNLDISTVDKDVPVIRINYKSSNPEKASDFPNALAEAYIEDYIETKFSAADVTVDFLNERIDEIRNKLELSEQSILNYRNLETITNISQETETDLRKISQLKIQQTNLKMSLEAIKELERYIKSGDKDFLEKAPNFEAFTDLLSTEIIKSIKQLQAQKKDLLLQYTDRDEKVIVIDAKIEDLTSYLIESISNTRKNLETKYLKLSSDISESELVFLTVPEKERMMTILKREFEIFQQSYNFLNQKKIEAEIAKAAKIAFHRIITPARVSKEPVSPNRAIIKIVSALLGMFGAIGLIFIVHTLKARINDEDTIETKSLIPIALSIPFFKSDFTKDQYFSKSVAEWEIKQMLKPHDITCFTCFNRQHGIEYISKQISKSLINQNRKILFIEIGNRNGGLENGFWQETIATKNITKISVDESVLHTMTIKKWHNFLRDKAKDFDQTLLINSPFGEPITMATMAVSNLNIICVDTRLTPAKNIIEVDLMQQEFKFPNPYWALNRVGYTPSLIRETITVIKKFITIVISNFKK